MKKILFWLFALFLFVAVPVTSSAQDEEGLTPEDVELGEVRISFRNTDYPSIRVDGDTWDEAEFSSGGKQVSLHRINRTQRHEIKLMPNFEGLVETTLTVKPEDWKLVKVNRRDRAWQVEYKVTFKKEKPKPVKKSPEKSDPKTAG